MGCMRFAHKKVSKRSPFEAHFVRARRLERFCAAFLIVTWQTARVNLEIAKTLKFTA